MILSDNQYDQGDQEDDWEHSKGLEYALDSLQAGRETFNLCVVYLLASPLSWISTPVWHCKKGCGGGTLWDWRSRREGIGWGKAWIIQDNAGEDMKGYKKGDEDEISEAAK